MKLFNKTIDRQLFKQYSLGSDLSKQEVVAKIFNPQGAQSWFILNSDPEDPDYLWAIVDLGYGAEVGSVSRNELENYRGRFGLGFERDLSFDSINAEELYNGLSEGKYYAKGGNVDDYSDLYGQEVMALKNAKTQAKKTGYDYVVYLNEDEEISFARKNDFNTFFDKDECKILYTIDEKGNANKIKFYADGGEVDRKMKVGDKVYRYYIIYDPYKEVVNKSKIYTIVSIEETRPTFENGYSRYTIKTDDGIIHSENTVVKVDYIENNNYTKGGYFESNNYAKGGKVNNFNDGGEIEVVYERRADFKKKPIKLLLLNKGREQKGYTFSGKDQVAVLDNYNRNKQEDLEKLWNLKGYETKYADGGEVKDLIRERNELLNDMYNNEDTEVESSDIVKVGDVLYGDGVNGYVRIVKEVNDSLKGDYFILQDRFDDKFAFYITQIIRDLYKKELKIQNVNVSEKDFLYSNEVVNIKKELEFHKGRVNLYKKNPNDASNYSGISYSDYVGSESKIKKLKEDLKLYLKDEKHNFADGGNIADFTDNQQMIMNQNVELEHHHEELEDILEDKVPVPAWVVAKMATATQSISDVTHYLDGEKELMEEEDENENEEEDENEEVSSSEFFPVEEDEDEIKSKEVVEPINVSAETKAELTKNFTDDALVNLKGFLKGMEGIELRDDYTFDYKNEQFEIEPIINSDQNGVSNAVFTIFDGDGEEQGEVAYSREGGKQKFTANSELFSWNNTKFEDGGFMNGVYVEGGGIKKSNPFIEIVKVMKDADLSMNDDDERKILDLAINMALVNGGKYMCPFNSSMFNLTTKQIDYIDSLIGKYRRKNNKAPQFGMKVNGKYFPIELRVYSKFIQGSNRYEDKKYLVLYSNLDMDYLDGGSFDDEYDGIAYAKTKGKESVNWDKELREYVGSEYSKLTQREKEEIISDMQRDWDRSNSYAKGGVTYFNDDNQHRLSRPSGSFEKEIYAKVKDRIDSDSFVGSFGWKIVSNKKANIADGYLYKLDDYDKNLIKNLKLKQGEVVFRYVNRTTAIGGSTPFIKINIEKALLYFPVFNDNDDIIFETRGVTPLWISLIEGSFEEGGNVKENLYTKYLKVEKKDVSKFKEILNEIGIKSPYSEDISDKQFNIEQVAFYFKNEDDRQKAFNRYHQILADGGFMNNVYADGGQIRVGDRYKFNWTDTEGNKGYTIREVVKQNVISGKDFRTKVMIMKVVESSMPETVGRMEEEYKPSFKKAIERGMEISMQEGKPRMADDDYATGGVVDAKTVKIGDWLQKKDNKAKAKVFDIKKDKYSTEIFVEDLYENKVSRPISLEDWKKIVEPTRELERIKKVFEEMNYAKGGEIDSFIPNVGTIDTGMLKSLLIKNADVKSILSDKEFEFLKNENTDVIGVSGKPYNTIVTDGNQEVEFDLKKNVVVKHLTQARDKIKSHYSKNYAKGGGIENDGYNLKDINGKKINVGDTVRTTQPSGGLMNPANPEIGIVEKTKDAFGNDALQIKYRKQGANYDQFILLNGKINEIVDKSSSSFEQGGFMNNVYAKGGGLSEIETSKSGKLKTNGEIEESWYNTFGEGIVNKKGEEVGVKINDINKGIVYYQALAKDTPENREGYGWEEHNDEVGFIYKKFATIDDLERFVNKTEDKPKYILKADIKNVTIKRNGKEVTYKGADVLNGANLLAKGGDITSKANYIPKRDVVDVELKDGSKVKPVNGYWVKKGAEPIGAEPTPTASVKSETKVGETYVRKDARGNWRAETNVENFNGYDWRISTVKTYSGNLVSSAQGGKTEATGTKGIVIFKYTMYEDPNHTLEVSKPSRLTDKVVSEQHTKGLAKFKKFMETGMFKGGGKISNFDKLSAKVAKEYEGKPIKNQYQEEYGKYYSREEAQEVGDKVAGKVKAMQTDSKAFGGLFKNVKNLAKSKPKYPNLEGKQVPLKSGDFVMVFTQDENTLSVINVGKIGSGIKPRNIDISEVDMTNFKSGGQTGTKKTNSGTETLKRANDLAKKIRMEGESWLDAKKRAFAELRKENKA